MPSNQLILCHPLLLQSFPASGSFPVSQSFTSGGQNIGVTASTSVLPRNIQLISFRMDWLDLLAVQGTLKSLMVSQADGEWCRRRLLRVPWTARISNQSILKEISPEYSLEGPMLKLQYFGHLMRRNDSLENTLMLGKTEGRKG